MKISKKYLLLLLTGACCATAAIARDLEDKHREFSLTKEKELRVVLDVSFGSISIQRGEQSKTASVDYDEEEDAKQKLYISYDVSNETGTLYIKLKESTHFWGDDDRHNGHNRHLDIKLGNTIPISFELELGAGNGDIDLTGLRVKDVKISTGASSVTMKCSKPNPIYAEDITIESGVSKFTATDLSNLNFHNLKFSGGVGTYKLDFDGKLAQSADVQIEVGLGSIHVYVPNSIPAKLLYDDNWLSSFKLDHDFEKTRTGVYETTDFHDASKRLTIRMESGLGSVRVERR
ncbi:MAG: hypothetical protein EHM64_09620 [Ignavibacteriae bacterium]|nr:MAG: hypothetical protein EHM64_09620 [Ignavibacteriota bacterium]